MNKAIILLITIFMIGSLNAQDKIQNINFLLQIMDMDLGMNMKNFKNRTFNWFRFKIL